jgi:NADPH:quinone reductase-like Zn-dependent oxidoreductase
MKAVMMRSYGGPEVLDYVNDAPQPKPGVGEVLVRVGATSLNPIDWKLRSGAYKERFPLTLPAILGRDLAGEVVSVGSGVTNFSPGLRVMALANQTDAEFCVVNADALALIPDGLDYTHAAALPLVVLTGCQLIELAAKVQRGQKVLITGAVGGVGRTAVFAALQLGAHVTVAVRARQKDEAAGLGADHVIAIDDEKDLASIKDFDVVADTVGGKIVPRLLKAIKPGGVYASVVGPPQDAAQSNVRVELMMAQPDAKRLAELAQSEAKDEFNIPIAKVMPLTEIRKAHELGQKGGLDGKVVLVP